MNEQKNRITEEFEEKLRGSLPELSRNNHYIAFLHDRITMEFRMQLRKMQEHLAVSGESKEMPDLVDHPFALSNNKIEFLLIFKDADDPVYKRDMDEYRNWFLSFSRADPESFFKLTKAYYSKKKSWVVQKILSLSEDFIEKLNAIGNETGIPLLSLHKMYIQMTGINDFCHPQQNLTPAYHQYRVPASYLVPVSVAPDQRDDLVIRVWKRIYNLLVECYWVVIVVGMVDFLNIVDSYKKEGLQKARIYLMHSVISDELKSRVKQIDNVRDLHSYLCDEFSVFESFFPDFDEFVKRAVEPIVEKGERRLAYPITPLWKPKRLRKYEPAPSVPSEDHIRDQIEKESLFNKLIKIKEQDIKKFKMLLRSDEELKELFIKKLIEIKEQDIENYEMLVEPDKELNELIRKYEDRHSDKESLSEKECENSGSLGKKGRIAQRGQTFSKEIPILSEISVVDEFEKKIEASGLLKTYHLKGKENPEKLIHYLFQILSRISKTITDKHYSNELRKYYGISSSTWRRWRGKIRKKEIPIPDDPGRPSGVRSINDLYEPEIREITRQMADRKEHHREGYLSQNQLIKNFQNDIFRSGLNKRMRINLKKYSRTALRNILNKLIKENRIPFEKFGAANLFKITDIPKIAQEIASFYSRNDS